MANEILQKVGQMFSFADHATDFATPATATNLEVPTVINVQLDTTDVADTAARQSAKADLTATRAARFTLMGAIEMAATPTTGEPIQFYWSASNNGTAANANAGYCTGVDGAYTGGVATLAEGIAQLTFIGEFICSADSTTTVQVQVIGTFSPTERYGSLVVLNNSGAAFHSDAVETHFVLTPIIDEIQ